MSGPKSMSVEDLARWLDDIVAAYSKKDGTLYVEMAAAVRALVEAKVREAIAQAIDSVVHAEMDDEGRKARAALEA